MLIIDFQVHAAGEEVADAGSTGLQVELGTGTLLKELEEALQGAKAGAEVSAEVPMPAGHPHPALAGNTATFSVTVKDLKERVLPEPDDEFAKDLGEFETMKDLKADINKQIEKRLEEEAENSVAQQLVADLCKHNPIPVPPSLVERQSQITEQELLAQARRQGQQGELSPDLKSTIAQDSELKVRAGLLMAEIAKAEGIQIGDTEIEEGLKELAEQTGKNVAKLRAEYRDRAKREMLVGMILENKVLDIIEGKAKIEDENK